MPPSSILLLEGKKSHFFWICCLNLDFLMCILINFYQQPFYATELHLISSKFVTLYLWLLLFFLKNAVAWKTLKVLFCSDVKLMDLLKMRVSSFNVIHRGSVSIMLKEKIHLHGINETVQRTSRNLLRTSATHWTSTPMILSYLSSKNDVSLKKIALFIYLIYIIKII